MDSTDVCQSVLGNFFGRATSGQFELKDPKQLVALLVIMARNRIDRTTPSFGLPRSFTRSPRVKHGWAGPWTVPSRVTPRKSTQSCNRGAVLFEGVLIG